MSLNYKLKLTNGRAPQQFDLTIGADPEFFLSDKDGKPVSAHGLVPGNKVAPHRLVGGAVQLDGTAVEFNIDPCTTQQQFITRIDRTLEQIRELIPRDYNFNYSPAVFYDQEYFDKIIPETSKELGCNPDHDAYNDGAPNHPPLNVGTMRTGAGHIHLGWGEEIDHLSDGHIFDCCQLAKNMDAIFMSCEQIWDKDTERRKMYGKPGCFRPKPYGMEYRSLSNAWLNHRDIWKFIFTASTYAFWATTNGHDLKKNFPKKYATKRAFNEAVYDSYHGTKLPYAYNGAGMNVSVPMFAA
jgi:hypothetical protein